MQVRESTASSKYQGLTFSAKRARRGRHVNVYYVLSKSSPTTTTSATPAARVREHVQPRPGVGTGPPRSQAPVQRVRGLSSCPATSTCPPASGFLSGRPIDAGFGPTPTATVAAADRPFSAPGVSFTRNAFRNEALKFLNLRGCSGSSTSRATEGDLRGLQRLQLGQHRARRERRHQLLRGAGAARLRVRRALEPELPVPDRQQPDVDAPFGQLLLNNAPGSRDRSSSASACSSDSNPTNLTNPINPTNRG